jgi:hypothetical protein
MPALILDLETILDAAVPFTPRERDGRVDPFPPAPHWQIVAFGALYWDREAGPRKLGCLGEPDYTEAGALRAFSRLLRPGVQLVTFNGRRFDLPVIVARSLRHRIQLGEYFGGRDYRYRFTEAGHLDLADQLSDYGAGKYAGLDSWSRLVGGAGKGEVDGSQVAELWAAGEHERVRRYCLDDVAQTARLWLEWRHLTGVIDSAQLETSLSALEDCVAGVRGEAA